ncbi:MAG: glycosyltransferase [archaeon]
MKVLHAATCFPDEYNPTIAPWSKKQVDSLHKYTDIDIQVVVPRPYSLPFKFIPHNEFTKLPKRKESKKGYKIHYVRYLYFLPKNIFFGLTGNSYSYFVSKYVRENIPKQDLIHARFGYLDGYGMLKTCKKWNVPLVFDVHGNNDLGKYLRAFSIKRKQKKTIEYASKILCVAKWQKEKAIDIGISEDKVEVLPLGVDIEKFKPRNKEELKNELEIEKENIVLFVGQLTKNKGVDYLLNAISQLDKNIFNNMEFIIVGDGNKMDELIKLAKKLNIFDSVEFKGKLPPGKELLHLYSVADLFVLPSLSEGRPTVINEAMASECAIVATNVSGIPEQVEDGYNGFLIEPRNPDQLAEKISHLLENTDLMEKMGKKSRKRIIENGWTWEGYAEKVLKVYKDVLDE